MTKQSLKQADKWFSKFIRLRDANEEGIIRCISCRKPVHWKKCDAGHFMKRQHMAVRFDEKNVNAQCKYCNNFEQGNDINYAIGLEKKYGPGIIEKLELAKRNTLHLGDFELKIIAEHYREKFNELMEENG